MLNLVYKLFNTIQRKHL